MKKRQMNYQLGNKEITNSSLNIRNAIIDFLLFTTDDNNENIQEIHAFKQFGYRKNFLQNCSMWMIEQSVKI